MFISEVGDQDIPRRGIDVTHGSGLADEPEVPRAVGEDRVGDVARVPIAETDGVVLGELESVVATAGSR